MSCQPQERVVMRVVGVVVGVVVVGVVGGRGEDDPKRPLLPEGRDVVNGVVLEG